MSAMTGDYIMWSKIVLCYTRKLRGMMSDNWREVSATWKGGLNFTGESDKGGIVQMGPEEKSIGPMQLLLTGLAGCTGIDIISILKKKKVTPTDFKVNVRGKRAETFPMVYTDIEVEYVLWGENLKVRDVEQAIKLSEQKYCSVSVMLGKTSKVTSTYKILKPGESEV
jgi:putative redox protein